MASDAVPMVWMNITSQEHASDREKFQKWAETLELAIGNPLYHWSHLELQRYFGYHGVLNGDTAEEVWNLCNAKSFQEDDVCTADLIRNVQRKTDLHNTMTRLIIFNWHEVSEQQTILSM